MIAEDGIRASVASSYMALDQKLFEQAVSDRLEFSKFGAAIGSMTVDNDSCELFEKTANEI